jgi:DNA-binding CsgD family transcriptional regulator
MSKILFRDRVSKNELYELYVAKELTLKEVGAIFGVSPSAISVALRHHGIQTRDNKSAQKSPVQDSLPAEDLYELYINQNKSTAEIAQLLGLSGHSTVVKLLRKYGIKARTSAEAVKTKTDISFFFELNKDLAYVLGLLATDGSIVKTAVKLGLNDREVIDWVANKVNYDRNISSITTSAGNKNYRIAIQNKDLVEELSRYGITERKTHSLKFPNIPSDLVRHFIRGAFDGDGSISVGKYRNHSGNMINKYGFTICTASLDFGVSLKEEIEKTIGGDRKLIYDKSSNMYKYSVSSLDGVYALYNWLYKEDDFGMERKKLKFKEVVRIYEARRKEAV